MSAFYIITTMKIDNKLLDATVKYLSDNALVGGMVHIPLQKTLKYLNTDFKTFNAICLKLQNDELLKEINLRRNVVSFAVVLHPNIINFIDAGGYTQRVKREQLSDLKLEFEAELLVKKLERLDQEAEKLAKTEPATARTILSLVADIATIAGIDPNLFRS